MTETVNVNTTAADHARSARIFPSPNARVRAELPTEGAKARPGVKVPLLLTCAC